MKLASAAILLLAGISAANGATAPTTPFRPMAVVPDLGYLEGITKLTVTGQKPIHYFRNLKFGDIAQRFAQPTLNQEEKGTQQSPFDASRYGPQCQQGGSTPEEIAAVMESDVEEAMRNFLEDEFQITGPANAIATKTVLNLVEAIFEVDLIGKTVEEIARDVFDIDYSMADLDCLQLAVSTPLDPTDTDLSQLDDHELLPVMFFVYGGGYAGGTQLKMDQARLGDADDIVLVTVNYRVGPLGFLCLDSDLAAGNMGMLDMVVGLEWVQEYIRSFGGDPNRVTVFGESAGAASIGHLVVSDLTDGLFDKGIGQSGSAVSPWAFDFQGHYHAREIAEIAGCPKDPESVNDDDVATCMIALDQDVIHDAYQTHKHNLREAGQHGYQGSIPCPQSAGERKFYNEHDIPHQIIKEGLSSHNVRVMFGANSHEGSYVYGVIYKDYVIPNDLEDDEDFFRYELARTVQETVGIDQSFDFDRQVEEYYFREQDMGSFEKMAYGILDLLSVEFLKASSYEMTVENSKRMPSYFYSHEHASRKSLYYAMYFNDLPPYIDEPGVCHADELMMLFNLNLPIVMCDLTELGQGLVEEVLVCAADLGIEITPPRPAADAKIEDVLRFIVSIPEALQLVECIADPEGQFKEKHGECLFGTLTESELETSKAMTQVWTNFARYGDPTPEGLSDQLVDLPRLGQWHEDSPSYIAFKDGEVAVESDYKKTYNAVAKSHYDDGTTQEPGEPPKRGSRRRRRHRKRQQQSRKGKSAKSSD